MTVENTLKSKFKQILLKITEPNLHAGFNPDCEYGLSRGYRPNEPDKIIELLEELAQNCALIIPYKFRDNVVLIIGKYSYNWFYSKSQDNR